MLRDPSSTRATRSSPGIYGAWPDKTGFRGVYQGGSAAKVFTGVVAARAGLLGGATSCPLKAGPRFPVRAPRRRGAVLHAAGLVPGRPRPSARRPARQHPDFIEGMAVSCNVYFGQLGLQLGPEAVRPSSWTTALEMGFGGGWYDPGKPGSRDLALTAFGQHASMMNVSQAARLVGAGRRRRRLPPVPALDGEGRDLRGEAAPAGAARWSRRSWPACRR